MELNLRVLGDEIGADMGGFGVLKWVSLEAEIRMGLAC